MRKGKVVVIGVLVLMLVGCAYLQSTFGVKPWADRTPSEKSLAILETYNTEYRNTMSQAKQPNLTEPQKQVVRSKKDVLIKVYPLIGIYDKTVLGGGTPSKADEDAILALFDQIGAKLTGR